MARVVCLTAKYFGVSSELEVSRKFVFKSQFIVYSLRMKQNVQIFFSVNCCQFLDYFIMLFCIVTQYIICLLSLIAICSYHKA